MATNKEIIDYVIESPDNTNPNVLRSLLESNGGDGGDIPFDNAALMPVVLTFENDAEDTRLVGINVLAGPDSDHIQLYPRLEYTKMKNDHYNLYYFYSTTQGNTNLITDTFIFTVEGQSSEYAAIFNATDNSVVDMFEVGNYIGFKVKPKSNNVQSVEVSIRWQTER